MTQQPGIREKVYLAGMNVISRGPARIDPTEIRAETSDILANGQMVVDRAIWYSGCQDVCRKHQWKISWDAVGASDLLHIEMLKGYGGTFDLCIWTPLIETFRISSLTPNFTLSAALATVWSSGGVDGRGQIAVANMPGGTLTGLSTKYPIVVKEGTTASDLAVSARTVVRATDAPDDLNRTPATLSGALTSGSTLLAISYIPLFKVQILKSTTTYSGQQTGVTLELEQVG